MLPLVGVSSAAQLTDNVGALDLVLSADAIRQLEAAVEFELGFPGDLLAECEPDPFVFGDHATAVDGRGPR